MYHGTQKIITHPSMQKLSPKLLAFICSNSKGIHWALWARDVKQRHRIGELMCDERTEQHKYLVHYWHFQKHEFLFHHLEKSQHISHITALDAAHPSLPWRQTSHGGPKDSKGMTRCQQSWHLGCLNTAEGLVFLLVSNKFMDYHFQMS